MPGPTRIRAQAAGGKTVVRMLMNHDMESGQRKDAEGRLIPAWYIQQVTARRNGQVVLSAQWGPSVSKNPYLQFTIRGGQSGDRISISWVDNRGETRIDEVLVS
jgi:sulfur-oxidizing protein SoxZ